VEVKDTITTNSSMQPSLEILLTDRVSVCLLQTYAIACERPTQADKLVTPPACVL